MPRRRVATPARLAAIAATVVAGVVVPAGAAHAKAPFVPGTATGISQTIQIAPRTGGLAAAIVVGTSIADYRGSLAQASSQTLNLGVVGTTLTVQCDATPPAVKASQLPQPLIAESTHGTTHHTMNTAGAGKSGAMAVAGREAVTAKNSPQSNASFDGNNLDLPGILTVQGLHSFGHARLIGHRARIATAGARIGQIRVGGGAVVLSGLTWHVMKRTGSHPHSSTRFTMNGATIAGKQIHAPAAKLTSLINAINRALTTTGIHVALPHRTDQAGVLGISPLLVGIDNSAFGGKTINPILTALDPVTEPLENALTNIKCNIGSVLALEDLLVSGLDGTGGLDVDLGGATAQIVSKAYKDPFGHGGGGSTLGQHPGGHGHDGSTTQRSVAGGSSGDGGTTTTDTGSSSGISAGGSSRDPAAQSASVSTSCATLSPAGRPACTRGKGLTVGLVALALLGSFFAADAVVLGRRRRLDAGGSPTE